MKHPTAEDERQRREQQEAEAKRRAEWAPFLAEAVALAVEWYRKAADQGYTDAQSSLGWMYRAGKGVPQDDTKAVK